MNRHWMVIGLLAVAGLAGCMAMADGGAGDKKDKQEVKVTMDQLPAAVKVTLTKEAGAGKIGDIEKETKDGKSIYEADVTIDGKEWEIRIGDDGKLISKKLDDEDDDD